METGAGEETMLEEKRELMPKGLKTSGSSERSSEVVAELGSIGGVGAGGVGLLGGEERLGWKVQKSCKKSCFHIKCVLMASSKRVHTCCALSNEGGSKKENTIGQVYLCWAAKSFSCLLSLMVLLQL